MSKRSFVVGFPLESVSITLIILHLVGCPQISLVIHLHQVIYVIQVLDQFEHIATNRVHCIYLRCKNWDIILLLDLNNPLFFRNEFPNHFYKQRTCPHQMFLFEKIFAWNIMLQIASFRFECF